MDMIAPSVAAPGVDIIAPHGTGDAEVWDFVSGTSMASPHAAGAAALLTALHPEWTVAELQSALMTTANTSVLKEDGVTDADPFDMGSGRIDLVLADMAPLTLDIPPADFTAADPWAGGDPKTLNLPSMANSACVVSCTWTRTVTAEMNGDWAATVTSDTGLTLDVSPATFSLSTGETQDLVITADVGAPSDDWLFGEVTLTRSAPPATDVINAPAGLYQTKMPVAVVSTPSTLPSALYLLGQPTDSYTVADVEAIEITDLQLGVTGMVKADIADGTVVEDPTNSTPFDDPSQVSLHFIDVPAGSSRVVAEVLASESPDLDLFLGWDLNEDGIATANELGCISATGTALEYCSYSNPPSGTWWVIIQNWAGSTSEASDAFTLATAASGPDLSNLTPSGPSAVAAKAPFDLSLDWVLDDAEDGDVYYGTVAAGTAGASPDDLGTMDVDILITAPAFPAEAELTANIWSDHLTLMWPADVGSTAAESFEVYQDGTLLGTVPATTLEYDVTGLTPETAYDFEVVATGSGASSAPLAATFTTATDFSDDDTSIFVDDIEWLAGAGITKGCNPPTNDEFCPEDNLTRGQLAAMLNRALDLPAATADYFGDDDTSVFEADINAIAAAGITFGCNAAGTDYCPDDMVTRGELAAMFDRGLELAATSTDHFTDDAGHLFEGSINRLAEAGITKGCNPPTNDNYCPDDLLTRGQSAAFFRRAFS
jgi:subtilisin family serine protease